MRILVNDDAQNGDDTGLSGGRGGASFSSAGASY